jgi:hypothetical protein
MADDPKSNPKFFSLNRQTGEYREYKPDLYKYTREGKRVPYTVNDITNFSVQPYDDDGFEVMINPIHGRNGHYKVNYVKSEISNINDENENVVPITNILENYPGNINEKIAALKRKYIRPNSKRTLVRSYLANKQQVTADLDFLFNYYIKLSDFYKAAIIEVKGQEVLNDALEKELSYLNVIGPNRNALMAFNDYFMADLIKLDEVSKRYPVLKLYNPRVFSNPKIFFKKILELKHDFEQVYALSKEYEESSKKTMNLINARLKSMKRRRHNNNNSEPEPKRFTLMMPPRGGRRKTHKRRN